MSLELALTEKKQISLLKREYPNEYGVGISLLFKFLIDNLNIANGFRTPAQVSVAIELIGAKYWMLSLTELAYIFKKAITGDYGVNYNRLDIGIICEWINDYLASDEYIGYFEKQQQAYKTKQIEDYKEFDPEVQKLWIEKITKHLEDSKVVLGEVKPVVLPQANEQVSLDLLAETITKHPISVVKQLREYYVKADFKEGIQIIDNYLNNENQAN